mgnify:CR=1 FL=1
MSFLGRPGALRGKSRARPKLFVLGLVVVVSFYLHIGHTTHRDVSSYRGVSSAFSSATTRAERVNAKHIQQVSGVGEDFTVYPVQQPEPEKFVNGDPYEAYEEVLFPWLNVRGTSTSSVDSWTSSALALVPDTRAFKLRDMPFDGTTMTHPHAFGLHPPLWSLFTKRSHYPRGTPLACAEPRAS